MTTGARDASSWGSIATARPHGRLWRFLGLGALGRCARLLSQERGHILGSPPQGKGSRMRASLAARATGNGDARGERVLASAGPHVRGSKSSEGVSTFRIELQKSFDEATAQKSCSCVSETSARAVNGGLAQSGRPRRAKRLRVSSHGGKTVKSTPACEGTRKGVAVAGLRSMEGASGRSSRPLFTRGRGKRSRPIFPSVIAKSMTCEGWVTEASEVGCSRATTAGKKHPLQGARANRRSVRSAVKARHTPKPRAQARWGRSPNETRVLVDVVCFGICWSYASPRARHPSPQGDGAGSPSHERTHRAVDADAGQGRGERVRDARLRGRSRNEHPSTAQVVVARYDSRRSECGGARS